MARIHNRLLVTYVIFLTVWSYQRTLVKSQGALQLEPDFELSQIRKSKKGQNDLPVISQLEAEYISQDKNGQGPEIQDDQTLEWRLPREVLPSEYRVKISPNIDEGQADLIGAGQWFVPGEVEITVRAQRLTRNIVMHSKNVTINSIKVFQGGSEIEVTGFENGSHDYLNISLASDLSQGQTYTISIDFVSFITEELNGLYRSSYIDPDTGNRVWLATTQMEALHARQMFPCFDEPALKSIFHFTIGHMTKYLALFNTESTGTTDGPTGWVYETFAPTVQMSTYLLALIISEFTYTQAPGNALPGKTVRTYAPKHYIDANGGVYAAAHAENILAYFGQLFSKEYPLSKMDSAAVPDFYFGAMENYGLNIYRESALLVFPGISLESERWSITSVIAHELAHQWFGNLVSPAFWTHIWLNEGFATYFASISTSQTNPEFESKKRFLNDAVQRSMEVAADPRQAHSIKIGEVEWATKWAMDWFDRMAYEQSGSLIRMMDGFLTTVVFIGGLKIYLNQLEYKAAQQDDLFSALNQAAEIGSKLPPGLTMKDIMDTWTLKPGFPLVRVSRASSNRIYISQEKFTNDVGGRQAADFVEDELWHIPISIATQNDKNFNPEPEFWLDKNVAMTSREINADQWIILNAGSTGYYRVLYDVPLSNLIKAQLVADHNLIDDLTRSQIQDDYFAAAYQKYINIVTALDLTTYLAGETEIIVWNTVLKHLRKPLNLFSGASSSSFSNLREYLLPRIKSALDATGGVEAKFAENAGMPILRHQQWLDWACALEDEECRNYAVNSVEEWRQSNDNTIPRDIQAIVYCSAVAKGNDDIFNFVKDRYNDPATTAVQRSRLLNALACSTDTATINELVEGSITSGYFRTLSDSVTILQRLSQTNIGRSVVIRFIREKAQEIKDHFNSVSSISSVYSTATAYVSTPAELETFEVTANEIAEIVGESVKPSLDASLATIRANINWMSEYEQSFNNFFISQI